MYTRLDCYPCLMRQALGAARRAGASEALQHKLLLQTMEQLRRFPADATPAEMAAVIHQMVREETHNSDPYRAAKREATTRALKLYPKLKQLLASSNAPLETALRIAIAGNIIDLGVAESYDLEDSVQRVLHQPFAINGIPELRQALDNSKSILYLADNAGETVFDRVLVEVLPLPVTYVVKAGPVINDATREDAFAAGIGGVAEIIDNGSDAPGTLLDRCSDVFRERFSVAGLILAKGQANYESQSTIRAPVFFLLQTKCDVIARDLSVEKGSVVCRPPASAVLQIRQPFTITG
jgi:damage-control phosphatase, subfamily I